MINVDKNDIKNTISKNDDILKHEIIDNIFKKHKEPPIKNKVFLRRVKLVKKKKKKKERPRFFD